MNEQEMDSTLSSSPPPASAIPVVSAVSVPVLSTSFAAEQLTTSSFADSCVAAVIDTGLSPKLEGDSNVDEQLFKEPNVSANDVATVNLSGDQLHALHEQGFPTGLAEEIGLTKEVFAFRYWLVDNSGSMHTSDGKQIRGMDDALHSCTDRTKNMPQPRVLACTRWSELRTAVQAHMELAGLIQATTFFRFLNDPGRRVGPQQLQVPNPQVDTDREGADKVNPSADPSIQTALQTLNRVEPKGVTPLVEHLIYIRRHVEAIHDTLYQNGKQVVIVMATDGMPSDAHGESSPDIIAEFVNTLKSLQSLPVWIVIRLCTDDDEVVNFYNGLDADLELPLEVIDDYFSEAKEIYQRNKWLNYALPLHRCREMGYHHRILDLLDERLLTHDEMMDFVKLLFGQKAMKEISKIDMHSNWKKFAQELQNKLSEEGFHYNPVLKRRTPWIDMKQLERLYRTKGSRFRVPCCC